MTIRTVIVDDEALARRRVARMLEAHDDIEVVAECAGGRDAVKTILDESPDLVFLDVQMPDLDGFEVVRELDQRALPAIVFVTAYDQYALRAFDACAVDYVMKPFDAERFSKAVDRALRWVGSPDRSGSDERLKRLLAEVLRNGGERGAGTTDASAGPARLDRFLVRRGKKTHFVRASEVDFIESDGNYLRLHVGPQNHLVRGTLNECAGRLDPKLFVRIHRRYVVNMDRVQDIQPWFGGDYVVQLNTGAKLRLSRTFRDQFQERMLGG
jgi:two-component system LytT family response regulator